MERNAIESDFQSSKIAAGSHFVNKFKQIKVAYWSENGENAIESDFRSSKMAAGSHFVKKLKNKVAHWSEMARNAIASDFQSSCKPFGDIHSICKYTNSSLLLETYQTREQFSLDQPPDLPFRHWLPLLLPYPFVGVDLLAQIAS